MGARKRNLASQVEDIVGDALERVKALVQDSLSRELASLVGGTRGGAKRGPGRPPKAGRRGPGRPAKSGTGKPGRRSTASPEKINQLVSLVSNKGELAPGDAKKHLKLSQPMFAAVVRAAVKGGLIKKKGAGRGTRYAKG